MVDLGVFMGDCGRFMGDLGIFCGRSWFRLTSADNQLVRFKMCDFLKKIWKFPKYWRIFVPLKQRLNEGTER